MKTVKELPSLRALVREARSDGASVALEGARRGADGLLTYAGYHVASRSGINGRLRALRCVWDRIRHGMLRICSGDGNIMLVFR